MPSKSKKPCKYPRCPNLTQGVYCEQHTQVKEESKVVNNKQYDKYQRDPKSTAFYNSKAWRQLRQLVFTKQLGLCQECLKDKQLVKGNVVDHIIEIKDDWSKRLDEDNLQVLCHGCHQKKTMLNKKMRESPQP
jgi:5-methylcytosine-specific restriction protein A